MSEANGDWKTHASRWLFGQPTVVVLLFALVGMGAWFGRYLVIVGVPAHLDQIHRGYKEINDDNLHAQEIHAKRLDAIEERRREERLEMKEAYEKNRAWQEKERERSEAFMKEMLSKARAMHRDIENGAEATANIRAGKGDGT